MLETILVLASQAVAEITPSLDTLAVVTGVIGTCLTTPLQPATIRVQWTATNFNSVTQEFKVYRDGIFITSTDSLLYTLQIAGLVENDTHHQQNINFNYRVDIVRSADLAVLASRSVSATKSYGNCV